MSEIKKHSDNPELNSILESIYKNAVKKSTDEQQAEQPKAKVIQLPIWPELVRGVPNGVLRSALFGAVAKGRRRYLDDEEITAIDGVTIRYKGERLDQGDLNVWESILHAVRLQALGSECRLNSYQLLKLLGKKDTGENRKILFKHITRLVANALIIKHERYTYCGSLIAGAAKDEDTQEWVIDLNPKLRPLFANDQFTQIQWSVRHALDGHQLAQWLHGFYSSHAEPYPIKIVTLHRLCGSEAAELRQFTQTLRKALDAISEVSKASGEPFSYEIRDGLVYVEKQAKKRVGRPKKTSN